VYNTFSAVESIPPLTSCRRCPSSFSSAPVIAVSFSPPSPPVVKSPFRLVRQSSRLVEAPSSHCLHRTLFGQIIGESDLEKDRISKVSFIEIQGVRVAEFIPDVSMELEFTSPVSETSLELSCLPDARCGTRTVLRTPYSSSFKFYN